MHYYGLVFLPRSIERMGIESAVAKVMGRHDVDNQNGLWDFYQVGGRWTGELDGYDPNKDPKNIGEDGEIKWPTEWRLHEGDILRLNKFFNWEDKTPYVIITINEWLEKGYECWCKMKKEKCHHDKEKLEWQRKVENYAKKFDKGWAVVVDFHN